DWKALLTERLTATTRKAPLEGIRRGGWKLAYADKPSDLQEARETEDKVTDVTASVGLLLKEDGTVTDVIPGRAAHRAGVGPGMKLIAVNGRRWTAQVLRDAGAATKKGPGPLRLLLENGEQAQTYTLEHQGGDRYPRLERDGDRPDLLEAILRPLTKKPE